MSRFGDFPDRSYLALIGDLCASRELPQRAAVQQQLEQALERLNRELPTGTLAAGFSVSLGDEFQGLLADPSALPQVLAHFDDTLPRLSIRYGVGWGRIATAPRSLAVSMDGPTFHHARQAIETGKRGARWVMVQGFGTTDDCVLNALFRLMGVIRSSWSLTQAETVFLLRRLGAQKAVAEARAVSPSTVSEALAAARHEPLREAEEAVVALLRDHLHAS
jgi:hypothetical protein